MAAAAPETTNFDVVVVGGGPGGYVAAIRAAQYGFKTALVEGHKLGGECLNYGCIPSKALISAGHLVDKIKSADKMGIQVGALSVDLAKLIEWKASVVKQLTGGVGQLLKANGVSTFKGLASFDSISPDKSAKTLLINEAVDTLEIPSNGQVASSANLKKIQAKQVILATGSTTVEIPTFKFNGKSVLGSKHALEQTKTPKKIVVIGGGFIGLEIGTFYSKLGVDVTVVEATSTLLPGTDRDCVDVVQKRLIKKGVKIHLNTKALSYKENGDGVVVNLEGPEAKALSVEADWVLVTVGRKPRTQGLGLEKIGLKPTDRGFLEVNAHLQTSVPGVYAIGDVIGGPMLAHKASFEGLVAVEHMKDSSSKVDVRALPWAIFVDPEIASVGHTEESARQAGWDPVIGKCPFVANGRAITTGESEGFVKIIADKKTDQILGAHMVGPDVSNLIAEIAAYIEMGGTVHDLTKTVHAHPTLPETILEAAESVHGLAVHFFERKPRGSHHANERIQSRT